jgi:hypothetical protein
MAKCASCGETILFGGVTQGALRFCNAACQYKGQALAAAAVVPEHAAQTRSAGLNGLDSADVGPLSWEELTAVNVWVCVDHSRRFF